jgi:hypothetical protein
VTTLDDYAPRCRDERCEVKATCPLYLDRDNPNARVKAHTLRQNWESHKIPCLVRQKYFGVVLDEG